MIVDWFVKAVFSNYEIFMKLRCSGDKLTLVLYLLQLISLMMDFSQGDKYLGLL